MSTELKTQLRKYVIETFLFGEGEETFDDGASLLDAGIIDSTGVLEIVAMLEDRYGFEIEDDELIPENLDSLDRLARFVERKQQSDRGQR